MTNRLKMNSVILITCEVVSCIKQFNYFTKIYQVRSILNPPPQKLFRDHNIIVLFVFATSQVHGDPPQKKKKKGGKDFCVFYSQTFCVFKICIV